MIVLAHVSDTHLDGTERALDRARRVFSYLRDLPRPVDAVLVTGDIADHGDPAEYRAARELFSLPSPVFHCPGNHDERSAYRSVLLGEEPGTAPINQAHEVGGAVFALCDSTIPGQANGILAEETVDWLDRVLTDAAGKPAFVAFHHPPVLVHQPYLDNVEQTRQDRLASVLARHENVAGIFCGHAHIPSATGYAGRPLRGAPGVVSSLVLPWESGGDRDWADGGPISREQPPAFAYHVLDDTGALITFYRTVP